MFLPAKLVLLMGLTLVVLAFGVYAIIYMRRKLFRNEEEYSEDDEATLTTAQVESLKAEGLLSDASYQKLKAEAAAAAKRRAEAAHRKRLNKSGL
jgi:hypothetical protein